MTVKSTEVIPVRPNTTIQNFDYVVVDGSKYVLAVFMENGDKLRLCMYTSAPETELHKDSISIAIIDFKLSALTASPMARSPDLMAVLTNSISREVDPNRPQYRQLMIHSDDIQSYKEPKNADA